MRFPELSTIASILNGRIGGPAVDLDAATVTAVAIDSRACTAGTLFFALPGENSDGERYVDAAHRAGAVAAVVRHDGAPDGTDWSVPVVIVDNALAALHRLARWYVDTYLGSVTRIGITGSNGKTTTKELAVAALTRCGSVYGSRGNYNSETGLPLSVLETPVDVEYAVYEMAMSAPGEIAALAAIVRPTVAIITNIGTAHIGRLGSREAIAHEKKSIAAQFSGSETLLIHDNDDFVETLRSGVNGRVVMFGETEQNATITLRGAAGTQIGLSDGSIVDLPLPGYHNAINLLAVLRLVEVVGCPSAAVADSVRAVALPEGRAQRIPLADGGVIIHDAYNANLDSLRAACAMARDIRDSDFATAHLVFILGDMYELGEWSDASHDAALESVVAASPALLVLVGTHFSAAYRRWSETMNDPDLPVITGDSVADVGDAVADRISGSDVVLLKGSRGVGLEAIIPRICERGCVGV